MMADQPDFLPPRQIKAIGDAPTCLVQALYIFCLAHALHLETHSTTKYNVMISHMSGCQVLGTFAGPCPAMVLAATIRGGKAQKNGKPGYGGCLRNKDVLRCAHGAIARWKARQCIVDKVCMDWQCICSSQAPGS